MDIIKNKTNMTVEEASKLRNGHGMNLNGGNYVHPSIPENPTGDGLQMIAACVAVVIDRQQQLRIAEDAGQRRS